jgi:DNA-directed RNA polymerase specialized sigma24 family protein
MVGIVTPPSEPDALDGLDAECAEFYVATAPRVVAALRADTGSRVLAAEAATEAYLRLVPRWREVSRYADPEAWVLAEATRIAASPWRRAARAVRHWLDTDPRGRVARPVPALPPYELLAIHGRHRRYRQAAAGLLAAAVLVAVVLAVRG